MIDVVKLAKQKLGVEYFKELKISFFETEKSGYLKVERDHNEVKIYYSEKCMLFRALTLIKERFEEKTFCIEFNKRFEKNGYMIDCSRNGVVNLDTIKDVILILALMGQNRLLLYTEDTYKLDKYPWFGYLRGGYTKEEIKEVVAYGEEFGVELVPCIQTLGHLARPLVWETMSELRDGRSTLLVGEEKTYEFIEEMIKFSRECFKSSEIHIGMDESEEIGTGRYLNKHKFPNKVEIFCKHLDRVIGICEKYSFSPMIWSDMFFRLNTKDNEYYRNEPLPQETLDLIPSGVELVYWDYYHDDKKIYDDMNRFHKDTKLPVVFAGGAWRWKGFTPSIIGSIKNSVPAIESCVENNIKFVFTTAWGDNGNECSLYPTLPILALFSNADYYANTDLKLVDSLLKAITGETLQEFELMDLPDMPAKKALLPQYNPSKYFLYQDPLNGMFDSQFKPEYKQNYKEYVEVLNKQAKNSKLYGYVYDVLAKLCDVLTIKVDLGVRLRAAYKANKKDELVNIVNEIPELINKVDLLDKAAQKQWMKENKQSGYDVINGRLGYLKNRLSYTQRLVMSYINGEISKIEELENEILPFNGHDYEICWNWWEETITTQNI